MTTTDLARLRSEYDELASKATAGPWERLAGDEGRRISSEPLRTLGYSSIVARVVSPSNRHHADAALVWLRNNADAILDAAEASERLRTALEWAMAPNERYEGRHRLKPRCSEFMPTDAHCDCGYREAREALDHFRRPVVPSVVEAGAIKRTVTWRSPDAALAALATPPPATVDEDADDAECGCGAPGVARHTNAQHYGTADKARTEEAEG